MTRGIRTAFATTAVLLILGVAGNRWSTAAKAQAPSAPAVSPQRALLDQYCMGCHSDRVKSGGLALSKLNLDTPVENGESAEVAEKVIRKLRGGLMPPASTPKRPDAHASAEFVSWLENKIDSASTNSNPDASRCAA